MVFFQKTWIYLAFGLFLSACTPQHFSHSELFQKIMKDVETSTFRGTTLGEHIDLVKEHESPLEPTHEDIMGLRYQIDLDADKYMIVVYYKDNVKTETESNRVTSIVANIYLTGELETAQLYGEIQDYFIQDNSYGLASGTYGNYIWESRIKSGMEVLLKLDENKNLITLNFIDTQPVG